MSSSHNLGNQPVEPIRRPPPSFVSAVQAVERFLSIGSKSTNPSSVVVAPVIQSSPPLQIEPHSLHSKDLQSQDFPTLDDFHLESLLPGDEFQHSRQCVKSALDEMELNFKLDPKVLGDRSDTNNGYRTIALLLSKVRVGQPTYPLAASAQAAAAEEAEPENSTSHDNNANIIGKPSTLAPAKNYETHDLLKAIDQKDSETILSIRDANFDLLLDLNQAGHTKNSTAAAQAGGSSNTPLGYSIGLGKDWQGISIVIVGALSKFINNLPDDQDEPVKLSSNSATSGQPLQPKPPPSARKVELDPSTMTRLRKIRTNLKLAMEHSVYTNQTPLLASYLQVLVMSEGSFFLNNSIQAVQHCITAKSGHPVSQARSSVLQFVTSGLRHKKDRVAAVKDYVDNATSDLVLMAIWDLVKLRPKQVEHTDDQNTSPESSIDPDLFQPLPHYFFARDDRITSTFIERVENLNKTLESLATISSTSSSGRSPSHWKLARVLVSELGNRSRSKGNPFLLEDFAWP